MWLIVWWHFAQITDSTLRKLIRPPFAVPAMLLNGHAPSYGDGPPTSTGGAPISTGNFVPSNVSSIPLTPRNAKFPKDCFIAPWLVSTPALGPAPAHSPGVNTPVPTSSVGHAPVGARNRSM